MCKRTTISAAVAWVRVMAGAALLLPAAVQAQSAVEKFYSENDVTLMVGAAAGGSADYYARTLAPYLSKYIPGNPSVIVRNKRGAGGLIVASELQHTAPKDGTYIGTLQRNDFLAPLLSTRRVNFDPREVNHLGSISRSTYVIFSYGASPKVQTMDDVFKTEMILAGTGAQAENVTYPLLVNELLGGKFNIVRGFSGNEEQALAIERGEADGRAISFDSTERGKLKQWKDSGMLHIVMQFGLHRNADIPDVPNVLEAIDDPEVAAIFRFMLLPQEFGRPFAAPAGVPADRLQALRDAFDKAAADPGLAADLERNGGKLDYMSGKELQDVAAELMNTPPERLARLRELLMIQ